MKRTVINLFGYWICICLLLMASCHDDELFRADNEMGSSLEESGDYKISTFSLPNNRLQLSDALPCEVVLISQTNGDTLTYAATTILSADNLRLRMQIPKVETIADSDYELRIRITDGMFENSTFLVTFKNEMLLLLLKEGIKYDKLRGTGTESDPYKIMNDTDFNFFRLGLSKDSTHAAGIYFKQFGNFEVPNDGETDGRGYGASYPFAGHYEGNNYTLSNLTYIGAEDADKDSGIGLFSQLLDNATIANLTLKGADIRKVVNNCGLLAGSASGNIALSNITVSGSIDAKGNGIGGLIGTANEANITLTKCQYATKVEGSQRVGGLIGQANNATLKFTNVSTSNDFYAYAHDSYVGGLIGEAKQTACQIDSVALSYTITDEDSDVRIIKSEGDYAGGLIGYHSGNNQAASSFSRINVNCPIYAQEDYAGGLIGYNSDNKTTSFTTCTFSSLLEGHYSYVGGLVGRAEGAISMESCRAAKVGGGAATIKGSSYVGGFFGYLKGKLSLTAPNEMYLGIKGRGSCVGGIAGKLELFGTLYMKDFQLDADVEVTGSSELGSVAGAMISGNLQGEESLWSQSPWDGGKLADSTSFTPQITACIGLNDGSSTNAGGLVGYAENCTLKYLCAQATVRGKRAGGLVGQATLSTISHCINRSSVVTGSDYKTAELVGGLIAEALDCDANNLINYIDLPSADTTGGVIGRFKHTPDDPNKREVAYCANKGAVKGNRLIGGIVGYAESNGRKEILHCGNYGIITGENQSGSESDHSGIGGIAGAVDANTTLKGCANHGDLSNKGGYHGIGGIAGILGEDATGSATSNCDNNAYVLECCNYGTLTAEHEETRMGGLVGFMEEGCYHDYDRTKIMDCYNAGTVNSINKELMSDPGGIVGLVDYYAKCQNTVNWGKVYEGNAGMGTHGGTTFNHESMYALKDSGKDWKCEMLSADEMKKQDSFEGFDFKYIWKLESGDEHPTLRDCTFQFVK